jgi:hypothetical protein
MDGHGIFIVPIVLSVLGLLDMGIMFWVLTSWACVQIVHSTYVMRRVDQETLLSSGKCRLVGVGTIGELKSLTNLSREFFEPFIIQSSQWHQLRDLVEHGTRWTYIKNITLFVLGSILLTQKLSFDRTVGLCSLVYLALLCVSFIVRPLYFRIVPGKVEVLIGTLLTNELTLDKTIPIGEATIIARFDKGHITIRNRDEEGYRIEIGHMADRREFVRKIFFAAISPHLAPNLPADTLLS